MKKYHLTLAFLAAGGLSLAAGSTALAQDAGERIYLEEEASESANDWAIGLSFGLVELGDNVVEGQRIISDDDVETYLGLSLRIPFGNRQAHGGSSQAGYRGYLEPELGYWEGDAQTDTLFGVNIIGGIPFNAVEFFMGGGIGVHFVDDDDFLVDGVAVRGNSDEAVGVNAQVGVDVSINRSISLYGVGRFDLIDDTRDELEGKAYVGLRFRF